MCTIVLIATAAVLLFTWLIFYFKQNQNLPPGPIGLPIVGYYPFLSPKPYLEFTELSKRYGNIFSFNTVGGDLIVVLNGVDTIKNVLINRAEEFIGRPLQSNLGEWISEGLGIAQEEGQDWKEHRRFFLHTAKTFGLGKQESDALMQEEVKTLVDDLKKENGKPADLKFHVSYAVNSVMSQILFSKKFEKYSALFGEISSRATNLIEIFTDQRFMLVGPFFKHIVMKYFPRTKKIRKAKTLFNRLSKELVEDHIKTFDPENLRDFIDSFLEQKYKLDKTDSNHSFTVERLESLCSNTLMDGTESVAKTICLLMDVASRHVNEQKIVQAEIDSVLGKERLASWADRTKLPYLEAFIQELLRHNMTFYISNYYCNFKETTIQGYRIPRRTILLANQWSINNDPLLYPEPQKFDPKRFVDDKNGKKIKTEGPYPFGVGKRSCIVEFLAQMEIFVIMAALLQNFTLYPADGKGYFKAVPR